MRLYEIESDENAVYFCFINSNPPTFGYKRALDKLRELSGDSDSIVFINPVQDSSLFPLSFKENLKYNQRIFTNVHFDITGQIENPIQALKKLSNDYSKIYFVTRDKHVNEFKRLSSYAEQWGVSSFDVVGLGDSTRPLPTGTSKEAALEAVAENDFESFGKTIPSNDKSLVSRLFLDLRKIMIDSQNKTVDGSEDIKESIYETLMAISNTNSGFLTESATRDTLNNNVLVLEGLIDSLKNLKLVFNPKSTSNVKLGNDVSDGNMVIILKCKQDQLSKFLDLNEKHVKEALGIYITETTTSANIASTTGMFADIVKRPIDMGFLNTMKFNKNVPKYVQAMNHVINTYGYMDSSSAQKIKDLLDRG